MTRGGDTVAEVGRGKIAKGLECQEKPSSQGRVVSKGGQVWSLETYRMVKSRDSGLRQPGFKSLLYTDSLGDLGQVTPHL